VEDLQHKLEILNSNYWEHFKFAKDLAGFLDHDHPRRRRIEDKLNEMVDEIHQLNKNIKDSSSKLNG
jgi:hypothetical protein